MKRANRILIEFFINSDLVVISTKAMAQPVLFENEFDVVARKDLA